MTDEQIKKLETALKELVDYNIKKGYDDTLEDEVNRIVNTIHCEIDTEVEE